MYGEHVSTEIMTSDIWKQLLVLTNLWPINTFLTKHIHKWEVIDKSLPCIIFRGTGFLRRGGGGIRGLPSRSI